MLVQLPYWHRLLLLVVVLQLVPSMGSISQSDSSLSLTNNVSSDSLKKLEVGDWSSRNGENEDGPVHIASLGPDIFALDTDTGNWRWHFRPDPNSDVEQLTVANEVVYAGVANKVYAIDAKTGSELWQFRSHRGGTFFSSPVVINGVVFANAQKDLYAINAANGGEIWNVEDVANGYYSPDVVDGSIYTGDIDNNIYVIDAATGKGKKIFVADEDITSAMAVSHGTLYFGSSRSLNAVDIESGAKRWTFRAGTRVYTPVIYDGVVYAGSMDSNVYALNSDTGSVKWSFGTGDYKEFNLVVVDGVVYFGSLFQFFALDSVSGGMLWRLKIDTFVTTSALTVPVVMDGLVYFQTLDDEIYAVDASTGEVRWRF